jgi:hypothetical protein
LIHPDGARQWLQHRKISAHDRPSDKAAVRQPAQPTVSKVLAENNPNKAINLEPDDIALTRLWIPKGLGM